VETSVVDGGIAVFDSDRMLAMERFDREIPASARLIPAIELLLSQLQLSLEQLDGFAVSIGPGSFTGLRVGLTAVKTLARFLDRPVIPVPTLMALAVSAGEQDDPVGAILDARKGEVFGAYFRVGADTSRITPDRVLPIETFIENRPSERICLVGNGIREYRERIDATGVLHSTVPEMHWEPSPEWVGRLAVRLTGETVTGNDLFKLAPVYIRRSEAEIHWDRRTKSDSA